MTFFLYDRLQPLALFLFRVIVALMRIVNEERWAKLIQSLDIRQIDGRPAYEAIQLDKFQGKNPVWIHAASGEFEYAKPVVRALHKLEIPVFVTYFSPTYMSNIESFPGVAASCALPLEDRSELRSMIKKINPRVLLIARTDTWPNMVRECSNAKIPVLLFSATFHERSKRVSFLAKSLTQATYKLIDEIHCVNPDDLKVLATLGKNRSFVKGDTRYDQVLERLKQTVSSPVLPNIIQQSMGELVLTAGSVWEEDVTALLPALAAAKKVLSKELRLTCLMVPHEIKPRFIEAIRKQAESIHLKALTLTELISNNHESHMYDVLIVDRVGILAELYLLGQFAFVGGSFKKTVHSVMEPLAAGCLTFVGPLHLNNREAIEFQSVTALPNWTAVVSAGDAASLKLELSTRIKDYCLLSDSARASIRSQIQTEVRNRGGATDAVLGWINSQGSRAHSQLPSRD